MFPSAVFLGDCIFYWDGGPSDRVKTTPYVATAATNSNLIHNSLAISHNGTTTNIDCGSQIIGSGNITVVGWFLIGNGFPPFDGAILHNGKFYMRIINGGGALTVSSDGSTEATSGSGYQVDNAETFFAVTRTSSGVVNIYKNTVLTGSADQSSGTPANGSSNLFIGNDSTGTYPFHGNLSNIRVFNQILTTTQIGQIYNWEL